MYIDDAISPESLERYAGQKGPQAMKAVAQSMATLFTYELVKEMRSTTMQDNQDFSAKTYTSMFDMELAQLLAEKETGLQDMILKQIERINTKATDEQSGSNQSNLKEKTTLSTPVKTGGLSMLRTGGAPGQSVSMPASQGVQGAREGQENNGRIDEKTKKMIRAAFGGQASNAMAVAYAESSGNPEAAHYNAPYGSTDCGLFQINDRFWAARLIKKGIINSVSDLFDPQKNIQAAAWIYKQGGWGLWTSVRSGRVQIGPPDTMEADNSYGSAENSG